MNRDEFAVLLRRFAERPIPSTTGRHLYAWHGALGDLTSKAPRGVIAVLDLHELCRTLERTPGTNEAARKVITNAIDTWLTRNFPRDGRQRALAVTGCDLLMRYNIPLAQFVRLASESRLIALVVPSDDSHYQPTKPLPAYVRLQPDATLSYLKTQIADEAIIGERVS